MNEELMTAAVNEIKGHYLTLVDGAQVLTDYGVKLGAKLVEVRKGMNPTQFKDFVSDLPFGMTAATRFMSIYAQREELKALPFGLLAAKFPDDEPEVEPEEMEPDPEPEQVVVQPKKETVVKPTKDPEKVYDMADNVVPANIVEMFIRADEIRSMTRQLNTMIQTINNGHAEADELFQYLHPKAIIAQLNDAKRSLRFAAPYAVCPYCKSNDSNQNCDACHGTGWVSERVYKAVPEELKG